MNIKDIVNACQSKVEWHKSELKSLVENSDASSIIETLLTSIAELTAVNEELLNKLAKMEIQVKAIDLILHDDEEQLDNADFRNEFFIDARMPMDDRYFYALEYADDGSPIRWTGKDNTIEFNVCLDRREDLEFNMRTYGSITEEHLENVFLSIGGYSTKMKLNAGVLSCIIPKSSNPRTAIRLSFSEAVSPYELNGSEDHRKLIFAFKEMKIGKIEKKYTKKKLSVLSR